MERGWPPLQFGQCPNFGRLFSQKLIPNLGNLGIDFASTYSFSTNLILLTLLTLHWLCWPRSDIADFGQTLPDRICWSWTNFTDLADINLTLNWLWPDIADFGLCWVKVTSPPQFKKASQSLTMLNSGFNPIILQLLLQLPLKFC